MLFKTGFEGLLTNLTFETHAIRLRAGVASTIETTRLPEKFLLVLDLTGYLWVANSCLPNFTSFLRRTHHRRIFFAAKRLGKCR